MRAPYVIALCSVLASPSSAQEPAPRSQLTLDASVLAGGLTYAHSSGPGELVGVGAGIGAEFNLRLVAGEKRGKKSTEVAHVEMFKRFETPGRWHYDLGVKLAADLHEAQVASESEVGGFLGGYIAPMWGSRHFRIGPRLQTGLYWASAGPTVGVFVTPFTARLLF